jgi:hypothetical protein
MTVVGSLPAEGGRRRRPPSRFAELLPGHRDSGEVLGSMRWSWLSRPASSRTQLVLPLKGGHHDLDTARSSGDRGLRRSAVPVQGVVQPFGGPVKVNRGVLTSLQGSAGVLHPLTYHVKCA